MINVKTAVKTAVKQLVELLDGNGIPPLSTNEITLEEVELKDSREWKVTLSFPIPEPVTTESLPGNESFVRVFGDAITRKYRVLTIDATDGEFISMKAPE